MYVLKTQLGACVQRIADTLDAAKIDAVFHKWLHRLPHPFAALAPLCVDALNRPMASVLRRFQVAAGQETAPDAR